MAVVDSDIQAWQALLPDRAGMRPWLNWFVGSFFARVRPGIGHDCKVDKRSITKGTVVSMAKIGMLRVRFTRWLAMLWLRYDHLVLQNRSYICSSDGHLQLLKTK
jgi:hypothetical protein